MIVQPAFAVMTDSEKTIGSVPAAGCGDV